MMKVELQPRPFTIGISVFLTIVSLSSIASAGQYAFQKIVDSSGLYKLFTSSSGPSINNHGDVVFPVELDNGSLRLELWTNSGTQTIATSNGTTPYRDVLFSPGPVLNNQGQVAFYAVSFSAGEGIFTGADPAIDLVADVNGPYEGFGIYPAINDSGSIVFQASLAGGVTGLFRGPNPVDHKIVDSTGAFSSFSSHLAINNAGALAFVASLDAGGSGVFSGIDSVADRVVDSSGPFSTFQLTRLNNNGELIFQAQLDSGVTGLFTGPDPVADKLVRSDDGFEFVAGGVLNDHGKLLFGALFGGGKLGLFTGSDPVVDRVVATGDPLFGSTITSLSSLRGLNNAGQITFGYALANGEQGIVIASPLTPGDYNLNGEVDAADYVIWRNSLGQTGIGLPADGNGNNRVDHGDYEFWQGYFGNTADAHGQAIVSVPEPSLLLLLSFMSVGWTTIRLRRP